ncbi:MAG: LysR family transcriptional regulator [Christensenella sp.]|uniref:LysR family transcriptional regulator n=1 Tax=Christensenella sp. TaxID=1935934 RepID=UPI002B1F8E37|nr:LysR family transcriptional regulator [Christensenella sp.]MEA5003328.1 LysR family transcriptional regulator [Christensenella sp.]
MDIKQLRYYTEVVKCGSYTKAAENLNVTQPMLTRTVKQLEDELEVKLIERNSKCFLPTDAGSELYQNACSLLLQYKDIYRSIGDIRSRKKGKVSISIPGVILDMYFPMILKRFYEEYPNIDISVIEEGSKAVAASVFAGDVDLGIVMLPVPELSQLGYTVLIKSVCKLLTSKEHPFAHRNKVRLAELKNERLITFGDTATLHDELIAQCRKEGFIPHIAYKSLMPGFDVKMVSYGLGIAVLPSPVIQWYKAKGLREISTVPEIPWEMAIIYKKGRYQSFAAEQMLRFIQDFFIIP